MRSKPVAAAVIVLVLLIGGIWFIAYGWSTQKTVAAFLPAPYTASSAIDVHVNTVGNTTTYSGVFPLMSKCGTMSTGIAAIDSTAPHITLLFTVLEPSDGCDVPGQTTQDFSASYIPAGTNQKPVFEGVTINGIIAKYTLTEDK